MNVVMAKPLRMHVARTPSKYVDKAGDVHRYETGAGIGTGVGGWSPPPTPHARSA